MKSAQAYLEEFLGDPDKAARYLRELCTECRYATYVAALMIRLVRDEQVPEERLKHNDVYRAFTDAAKLSTQAGTTGHAFRDALKSAAEEAASDAAKKAAEAKAEAVAEAEKKKGLAFITVAVEWENAERILRHAEIEEDSGNIVSYMIVKDPTARELLRKEMKRNIAHKTDKSHDLCDPLLAISPSERRFLPRRRARGGAACAWGMAGAARLAA